MIKKNSLSFRIIRRVLIFTLLLFIVILSLFYYFARTTIQESARENAVLLAENTVGEIENEMQQLEKIPEVIAGLMEIDPVHEDTLFQVVETILLKNDNVYGAAIAFEPHFFREKGRYFSPFAYRDGNSIHTMTLGGEHYEYFFMDWYQIPKVLDQPYWTEPYYDEGGGEMLMSTYSVPFYTRIDGERKFSGIATVDLSLEWLREIVSDIQIFETGYAFLLSRNGVAVTHPNPENIMNESLFSIAEEEGLPELRQIGRDMLAGESRFREHALQHNGKQWIYHTPLPSSKWSLGVVFPDEEMFASLNRITTLLIFLTLAGLVLLSLFTVDGVNRIAAPLTHFARSARRIADGNFETKLPTIKSKDEMKELHDAFSQMQADLATYMENLKETTAAKEKIESELRIAREIQMSMIPHTFPPFPDLPQVDLYATLRSAKEVGGDLYDFFVVDKTKFCFAIGDVSGKGVPASLFMAVTRTLLRTIADKEQSPASIMNTLNKSLAFNNESNMFVTFFLGILDLSDGTLQYANAGHNPPVYISKDERINAFEPAGTIPLGLFEDFTYTEASMQLTPGDKIFAYTDGISEAENSQNELFGEDRMMEIIRENREADPQELVTVMSAAVEKHVQKHPQSDDITMLTVSFNQ